MLFFPKSSRRMSFGEKPVYSHARGRMCFMHVKCVMKSECVCSVCSKVQHMEHGVALKSARTRDLPLSDVIGTLHGTWGTRTDAQSFANQTFTNGWLGVTSLGQDWITKQQKVVEISKLDRYNTISVFGTIKKECDAYSVVRVNLAHQYYFAGFSCTEMDCTFSLAAF